MGRYTAFRPSERKKRKRPKTFKSVELAKAWAAAHNITDYELVDLRPWSKKYSKIRIISKKKTS